ncbi:MarR family winged helix-turn-helix transcriptional regulator [Amycolatopsis sp. FDAARGOS 1241]|uniref:MarR family winged helix-turn-helix transcriptional regulator n=1 Tax=Amycolatopsis sp. FDAARGOS 1241 TaxID=2778070 RepID=UPI0019505EF4|nr:MarR family transcriptional regulator [Amycolatopsis sp. FDAARGOS 1241]QRP48800.1 winged helix DNA-binding protein [Amycolatopsis sp. FDAARGOS 1241]
MPDKPLPALPDRNTAAALHHAYLHLAAGINAATRACDPRTRAARATVFIHLEPGGIRLTRLAEKALMTSQAMGELVDDLERLGYLRREPDPADRRAKLIRFTNRGSEALGGRLRRDPRRRTAARAAARGGDGGRAQPDPGPDRGDGVSPGQYSAR